MTRTLNMFPDGYLLIREFPTVTEAHVTASRLCDHLVNERDFRLVEVSPTAAGAWVCAYTKSKLSEAHFDTVEIDEPTMSAFLSLGSKPPLENPSVGIIESQKISDVFRAAREYSKLGMTLLELRVKRSGPSGAYAFFSLPKSFENAFGEKSKDLLPMAVIPLTGDYRRFFL